MASDFLDDGLKNRWHNYNFIFESLLRSKIKKNLPPVLAGLNGTPAPPKKYSGRKRVMSHVG